MSSWEMTLAVLLAILAPGGVITALLVKFDRRNTAQHVINGDVLDTIRVDVGDIKQDLNEVKADVRFLRGNDRDHESRLHILEHLHPHKEPPPDESHP
jgi:hypothetical protein